MYYDSLFLGFVITIASVVTVVYICLQLWYFKTFMSKDSSMLTGVISLLLHIGIVTYLLTHGSNFNDIPLIMACITALLIIIGCLNFVEVLLLIIFKSKRKDGQFISSDESRAE